MMAVFWVFIPYLIGLLRLFQRNALPPFSDWLNLVPVLQKC
jgi:hypothetical protein